MTDLIEEEEEESCWLKLNLKSLKLLWIFLKVAGNYPATSKGKWMNFLNSCCKRSLQRWSSAKFWIPRVTATAWLIRLQDWKQFKKQENFLLKSKSLEFTSNCWLSCLLLISSSQSYLSTIEKKDWIGEV